MPKRTDIKSILIIGSGPIVIGQACEFDYSGTQACRALREEGYRVILVNSNPATIMTDPELADATYLEPLVAEVVTKIIEKERPDALLPTLGGQTGLNLAMELYDNGVLDRFDVEMIGVKPEAIKTAEDRKLFKEAMREIGVDVPKSELVTSVKQAQEIAKKLGYPVVIRPSFTLGGTGGGIAYNPEELKATCSLGLERSPVHSVLIEESLIGWKEFELEVMRDRKDNVVIVCSIENLDPMGVHTGDSITVAPAQTLTDKEYQKMRDWSLAIIRKIGVETGGSNIQFAVDGHAGRMVAIEANPRVSRSSALASKATGFPIAKIAAKLACGYTLEELPNDITRKTPACFEPAIDYVVVKVPRFNFEKFPDAAPELTTSMKSVGEALAFGRNFKEALGKGFFSTEAGFAGFIWNKKEKHTPEEIKQVLATPHPERIFYLKTGFEQGLSIEEAYELTKIDPWFLHHINEFVELETQIKTYAHQEPELFAKNNFESLPDELFRVAKAWGFTDWHLGKLLNTSEETIARWRQKKELLPVFKSVDTCAGEFEAFTPYFYSTYDFIGDPVKKSDRKSVVVLGSGPNRIGQGIEFDYACVHAVWAIREEGYDAVMVNSNPETVSTDYDTADRLYFEPMTRENVWTILERENPLGVFVGFGGQTPLKLAKALSKSRWKILGTPYEAIDIAEDRKRFSRLLSELGIRQPLGGTAVTFARAVKTAASLGYPVLARPSYVLGGQAMKLAYSPRELADYLQSALEVTPERPVLIDKFLEDAIELDLDLVSDGKEVFIGGIMEHIEEAGIHSGDSIAVLSPFSVSDSILEKVEDYAVKIARALKVVGLLNIQFAVKDDTVYVLEANPRSSRTVPFVSKAIGVPLAKIAAKVGLGRRLKEFDLPTSYKRLHYAVKFPVFPFSRFPGAEVSLGPQMKSTGEVMGMDSDLGIAFLKGQLSLAGGLPDKGQIFISVRNRDKRASVSLAKHLVELGFSLCATSGTAKALTASGISVKCVKKVSEGRPHIVDSIKAGDIAWVVNTPEGETSQKDSQAIRRAAVEHSVTLITTLAGAQAAVNAVQSLKRGKLEVRSLQEYFAPKLAEVLEPI